MSYFPFELYSYVRLLIKIVVWRVICNNSCFLLTTDSEVRVSWNVCVKLLSLPVQPADAGLACSPPSNKLLNVFMNPHSYKKTRAVYATITLPAKIHLVL